MGKSDELAEFLQAGRELAPAEQGAVTWYAFKINDSNYGILDTFEAEPATPTSPDKCNKPSAGSPDLLASTPDIRTLDVVAVK
ncbi:hypothetical protein [Streptomyces sp. NBC_01198]|uniref:hypothetical protein n=1 Tax=Streptomyces sp. NBC_01198 TaxID=2903769 RepID=UPI002E1302D6|nr:hypothetical protein OG702_06155 [Streptomyces sp. NBC_01198]